jgi:hypothetical protein
MTTLTVPRVPAQRFPLGQVMITPGAFQAIAKSTDSTSELLSRHAVGDWGDMCQEDAALNDQNMFGGGQLLSAYALKNGNSVWVITEGDRSATTFLLPDEY